MYKVVRVSKDGKRLSYGNTPHALEYSQEKWTTPKIGKLFVFDTLENAKNFLTSYHPDSCAGYEIYDCEVKNEEPCDKLASVSYIVEFWNKSLNYISVRAPRGTYMCDAVRLKERVF